MNVFKKKKCNLKYRVCSLYFADLTVDESALTSGERLIPCYLDWPIGLFLSIFTLHVLILAQINTDCGLVGAFGCNFDLRATALSKKDFQ